MVLLCSRGILDVMLIVKLNLIYPAFSVLKKLTVFGIYFRESAWLEMPSDFVSSYSALLSNRDKSLRQNYQTISDLLCLMKIKFNVADMISILQTGMIEVYQKIERKASGYQFGGTKLAW